jgi:hypothetical protein
MGNKHMKGSSFICLLLGAVVLMAPGCQRKQAIYVIGGYGWMARFIDQDGNVITDGVDRTKSQYNLANELIGTSAQFVAYKTDQAEPKTYDCGACHTTGFTPEGEPPDTDYVGSTTCIGCHQSSNPFIVNSFKEHGHQFKLNVVNEAPPVYPDFCSGVPEPPDKFTFGTTPPPEDLFTLPGIQGQWVEPNVGCEACHGPGKEHQANPAGVKPPGEPQTACGKCHITGPQVNGVPQEDGVIEADGNLMLQSQEWEEWEASPHNATGGPQCATCHNPHASTIHDDKAKGDGRRVYRNLDCLKCHPGIKIGLGMFNLMCIDCHMPYAAKSAVSKGIIGKEGNYSYVGDVRSHQFKINAAAESPNAFFNPDRTAVQLDANGKVPGLTLNFVCQPCHSSGGIRPHLLPAATPYTFNELKVFAPQVHAE